MKVLLMIIVVSELSILGYVDYRLRKLNIEIKDRKELFEYARGKAQSLEKEVQRQSVIISKLCKKLDEAQQQKEFLKKVIEKERGR